MRAGVNAPLANLEERTVKVFVPFSEALMEQYGCNLGELVPFRLEYECFPVELPRNRAVASDGEIAGVHPQPRARRHSANRQT
jgi:hypothetical protein